MPDLWVPQRLRWLLHGLVVLMAVGIMMGPVLYANHTRSIPLAVASLILGAMLFIFFEKAVDSTRGDLLLYSGLLMAAAGFLIIMSAAATAIWLTENRLYRVLIILAFGIPLIAAWVTKSGSRARAIGHGGDE